MALTLLSPGRTSARDRDDSDSAAGIQQGFLWRKRATPPSQLKADPRWEASREPCPQGEAVPQTVGLGLRKQHLHLEYTEQNGSLRGLDENVIVWIPKSLQYELETTTKKKRCWFYFVIIKKCWCWAIQRGVLECYWDEKSCVLEQCWKVSEERVRSSERWIRFRHGSGERSTREGLDAQPRLALNSQRHSQFTFWNYSPAPAPWAIPNFSMSLDSFFYLQSPADNPEHRRGAGHPGVLSIFLEERTRWGHLEEELN